MVINYHFCWLHSVQSPTILHETTCNISIFTSPCADCSGLLFVGLPLRLYLADSPHLYELLRRMRQSCGLAEPSVAWPSGN